MNKFLEAIHDMIEIITGERPQTKRNGDRRSKDRGTDDRRAKGFSEKHTQEWLDSVKDPQTKPKRARGPKGRYKGDDLATKDFNEAWVGGKAPKKKKRKK
jgi:hypothetical protein